MGIPGGRHGAEPGDEPIVHVLHEDDELLVLRKPAGLVCHPAKDGPLSSLSGRLRLHLGPARPVHFVNRLDRETSGVLLVAKTAVAARALGKAMQARAIRKEYRAIVHGHVASDLQHVDAPLGRDEGSEVAIRDRVRADGAEAGTEIEVLSRFVNRHGCFSLVAARPRTGRKHQIRIHLAHLGHPIVGDKLYGVDPTAYLAFVHRTLTDEQRRALILPCHALHASALSFTWQGAERTFRCDPEPWFDGFVNG